VSVSDRLARRTAPRLIVLHSRRTGLARAGADARRRLGRRGRVELYVAFDDPCSAVALLDLQERLAGRAVRLLVRPVVRRGMRDDPAVPEKRLHAIADARRLAGRRGLTLSRTAPVDPDDVAFLAAWVAAGPAGPAVNRFAAAAARRLWCETDGPVDRDAYAALWTATVGGPPPGEDAGPVRRDERAMRRRGPYDTPAAWVHGRWYFAHDRPAQIADQLDDLGWTVAR
jgi:2-hydroxychromene-2-carboxylate isomerase